MVSKPESMRELVVAVDDESSLEESADGASATGLLGRSQRQVRMLVVETGAGSVEDHALRWSGELTVVMGQSSEELPTEFAVRGVRRILVLEQSGQRIGLGA